MSKASKPVNQIGLLVVQTTPFCNIDCSYCYLPDRDQKHRMTEATAANMLAKVLRGPFVGRVLDILWHAGEPLVVPMAFYRRFVELVSGLKLASSKINFSVQTNGTLIDDEWCLFFKETGTAVGISLDGPKHLHDACRRTRARRGTFDAVMRGLAKLHQHHVDFGVITVLRNESLDYPDELFRFYLDSGIRKVCFNVEEVEGVHRSSSLQRSDAYPRVVRFFERFWELAAESDMEFRVREFEERIAWLFRDEASRPKNYTTTPFAIVAVDWQGRFSTYSPELLSMRDPSFGDFIIGDFTNGDLADALNSPKLHRLRQEIDAGVQKCRNECSYFSVCCGGSPSNKLFENGSFASAETLYCRFKVKALTDVLCGRLGSAAGA